VIVNNARALVLEGTGGSESTCWDVGVEDGLSFGVSLQQVSAGGDEVSDKGRLQVGLLGKERSGESGGERNATCDVLSLKKEEQSTD